MIPALPQTMTLNVKKLKSSVDIDCNVERLIRAQTYLMSEIVLTFSFLNEETFLLGLEMMYLECVSPIRKTSKVYPASVTIRTYLRFSIG